MKRSSRQELTGWVRLRRSDRPGRISAAKPAPANAACPRRASAPEATRLSLASDLCQETEVAVSRCMHAGDSDNGLLAAIRAGDPESRIEES